MQVIEIMTPDPLSVKADGTVKEAAAGMRQHGIGALPVVDEQNELIGMVTDRDIAIRGVAEGLDSETPVERVMTNELLFASSSDELDDVLSFMSERQVRRLPVIEGRRLVGIVSQADIAAVATPRHAAETLRGVSEPAASNAELRHKAPARRRAPFPGSGGEHVPRAARRHRGEAISDRPEKLEIGS